MSEDAPPARDREIFGIDRRKALLTGGGALCLAVVAVVAIGEVTSFQHVVDALKRADGARVEAATEAAGMDGSGRAGMKAARKAAASYVHAAVEAAAAHVHAAAEAAAHMPAATPARRGIGDTRRG